MAIAYAFEGKLAELTLLIELFVQVYNCFEDGRCTGSKTERFTGISMITVEVFVENQIREMIDPVDSLYKRLL